MTIEDPVEYQIPGVNQTQINTKINLTFAGALRSILRQDPDVVLLGEIRDQETARIAMQAAQTGHLVLSTLHTDDAPSCVTRLTDIGIEPYVTASALIGVVAQRLVRRLCTDCRRPYTPEPRRCAPWVYPTRIAAPLTFYRAVGCERCNRIGYRGRVGIYEIMSVTDDLRRLIAQRGSEAQLREAAVASGMISLGEDGLLKVKAGMTTPQELLRVVTEVRHTRGRCVRRAGPDARGFHCVPDLWPACGGGCPHCRQRSTRMEVLPVLCEAGSDVRPEASNIAPAAGALRARTSGRLHAADQEVEAANRSAEPLRVAGRRSDCVRR